MFRRFLGLFVKLGSMFPLEYIERKTGEKKEEKVYGAKALSLFYGSTFFSRIFSLLFLPLFAYIPWISKLYGKAQKQQKSQKKIEPFIQEFGVDKSEFLKPSFSSFNDFFIRKLKPESRPVIQDEKIAVLPADGRHLVFQDLSKVETFYLKSQEFDLEKLLLDEAHAHRYREGSMLISRLCPTDYHRFHFPVEGVAKKTKEIPGALFSVNPIALKKRLSIFWENKRMVTEIETETFGTISYVEIGATFVGSIHQTYVADSLVKKGEEKGYFEFGGSCLVLLFEKGKIQFDSDLIQNSAKGFETKANFGESLGSQMK